MCRFLYSVERLAARYPPIVDYLKQQTINAAASSVGEFQLMALEILRSRADHLLDLMQSVRHRLKDWLFSNNVAVQNSALQLLQSLVPKAKDDDASKSVVL